MKAFKPFAGYKPIPDGFLSGEGVARVLGLSKGAVFDRAQRGTLPRGIAGKFYSRNDEGCYSQVGRIWRAQDIYRAAPTCKPLVHRNHPAKVPAAAPASDPDKPTPADLGLLARLRHCANADGFVDGDASDICICNPPRPLTRAALARLEKAQMIRTGLDNWDRLIVQLPPEETSAERPGTKEWRSF